MNKYLLIAFGVLANGLVFAGFEEEFETKQWQEVAVQLPAAPKKENLFPFYVSAATEHKYFVDGESLSLGSDGVVRYTLVVQTSGGTSNVSYEGMRCQTRERRPYAFGRAGGEWSRARSSEWVKVRESDVNRHYAALFSEYFCPGGVMVYRRSDVINLLRQGGAQR